MRTRAASPSGANSRDNPTGAFQLLLASDNFVRPRSKQNVRHLYPLFPLVCGHGTKMRDNGGIPNSRDGKAREHAHEP